MKTSLRFIVTPYATYPALRMDFGNQVAMILQCWCDVPPYVTVPLH